jgi:hypothetical protein
MTRPGVDQGGPKAAASGKAALVRQFLNVVVCVGPGHQDLSDLFCLAANGGFQPGRNLRIFGQIAF